jgi:hypothetical protein
VSTLLVLYNDEMKAKAIEWIRKAPKETRLTFQAPKRTTTQNSKFHAMVAELSTKLLYDGVQLSVDDYKLVFMDALNREMRIVPNLDNTGFVNLGRRTSRLGKEDFAALIEIVYAYAASKGVELSEGKPNEETNE